MTGFPRLRAIAEHSLLVEFGDRIAPEIHALVTALDSTLAANPPPGFDEAVPAYASLMIRFDPLTTDHDSMAQAVQALLSRPAPPPAPGRLHEIPVCYDGDFAPDLAAVAGACNLSPEAVIAAHLGAEYRVYMYGFAPGYAYLAGVPEALRLPRKPAPKRDVPAGSVLIAGPQCLISTLTMPTGWWIIGRSPARVLTGDPARPFLFEPGDRLHFRRIPARELPDG